ncbi:MAG: phage holin family protein [Saprospiraceae bacterium]
MENIIGILITATAFFVGAKLLSGVYVKNFIQAIIVAIVIAILSFTLGNFLKIVTLGILSLGIFSWLLNAILIQVADFFLKDFEVKNFWWALALAAIVSIVSGFLNWAL